MGQKLDCDIVRDLLPNYIEKLTSEKTSQQIEEHLENCKPCTQIYEQMREEVPVDSSPEIKDFKRYLNKTKMVYIMGGLLLVGILGVIVSLIVNIAVDRKLSWSIIVASSVLFSYTIGYTFIKSNNNKMIKAMGCITVLIIPYLGSLYYVINNILASAPAKWFWRVWIPITVIWLVTSWIMVAICKVTRLNYLYYLGILAILSIPGGVLTNRISLIMSPGSSNITITIINALTNLTAGVVVLFFGWIYENRKKANHKK